MKPYSEACDQNRQPILDVIKPLLENKKNGKYSSDSNKRFDAWLKNRDPNSGIRDFEALNQLAKEANLLFVKDIEMPANNRILQWVKFNVC